MGNTVLDILVLKYAWFKLSMVFKSSTTPASFKSQVRKATLRTSMN